MDFPTEILNFINDNYLKLIIGLVLILMAIIGYYAEKTNFGNKLKKDDKDKKDENVNVKNIGLNDFVGNNSMDVKENIYNDSTNDTITSMNESVESKNISPLMREDSEQLNTKSNEEEVSNQVLETTTKFTDIQENLNNQSNISNTKKEDLALNNENFVSNDNLSVLSNNSENNLEEEFRKIIPDEDSIEDDLMLEINNMKIDPLDTNKISDNKAFAKLSSNINLPEINDFGSDNDIWKF